MTDSVSSNQSPNKPSSKLKLSLDFRIISVVLLLVIAVMLGLWRPWSSQPNDQSRTISVTGDATLKEAPDEYDFNPTYNFQDADKATAVAALTAKQTAVVDGLKKLGVSDDQIKSDSNGEDYGYLDDSTNTYNYSLSLQVTLSDKSLTQKVQDYLVSTQPTGSVSPIDTFSETKRKQLESQGRDLATKDARSKAEQSAQNLGFKVGKVKSITDGSNGGGGVQPYVASTMMGTGSSLDTKQSLTVQAGQNELSYSVDVVYYID